MTILLRTALMRGRPHQIRVSRTIRAGRHRTRITDGTMGLHRRIKAGPVITRRHRHHRIKVVPMITRRRRIGTGIMIEIEITAATGMANHITTCTRHQELL
jgi:hypothetical protein